jgi:hypothetical protein
MQRALAHDRPTLYADSDNVTELFVNDFNENVYNKVVVYYNKVVVLSHDTLFRTPLFLSNSTQAGVVIVLVR